MIAKPVFETIPRADGVSNRVVWLGLGGRFMDELLSGLPAVLMPTIRAHLGLSYTQISLLNLTLNYVAVVVEPLNGLLIDVWRRRWLMAWGAAGVGLATAVMGLAPTYSILLLGFAIYGLASGPLAHTADVVLVDAHPAAPGRIFARANLFDSLGALLGPLSVSLTIWLGLSWRWLLVSLGFSSLVYGWLILRTVFPPRSNGQEIEDEPAGRAIRKNINAVLRDRQARAWLAFLFLHELLETPAYFTPVWLREQVGISQALVGLYSALSLAVGMASLLYLDRWLGRSSHRRVLQLANLGLLVLYPAWLFLPGPAARFLLGVPISFLASVHWPIGRGQSLASVPGRAGTVTAVHSLFGLAPLSLLFGLLAEAIGLTAAIFYVTMAALVALTILVWRWPGE